MKRTALILVAVGAMVFGLAQVAKPASQTWVYCFVNDEEAREGDSVTYCVASGPVTVKTWDELAQKLGGNGKGIVGVLDTLGAQGWELCSIGHSATGTGKATTYTFKRPK